MNIAWEGGSVRVDDDGSIVVHPTDRQGEVFAALAGTYFRQESIDDQGTIIEAFDPIDRTSEEHVRAALLSLPGAVELEERDVTA